MGNRYNNISIVVAVLVWCLSCAVIGADQAQITLYHYTDNHSAALIKESGKILQSTGPKNAVFKDGVYLTSLDPSNSKERLAKNNYDDDTSLPNNKIEAGKLDSYIKVVLWKDDPKLEDVRKKSGRDVYVYRGDLILSDMISFDIKEYSSWNSSAVSVSSGGLGIVLVIAQVIGMSAKFLLVN